MFTSTLLFDSLCTEHMHSSPGCSSHAVPLRSQYSCHWSDCLSLNSSGGGAYAALQQDPIGQVALLVPAPPQSPVSNTLTGELLQMGHMLTKDCRKF